MICDSSICINTDSREPPQIHSMVLTNNPPTMWNFWNSFATKIIVECPEFIVKKTNMTNEVNIVTNNNIFVGTFRYNFYKSAALFSSTTIDTMYLKDTSEMHGNSGSVFHYQDVSKSIVYRISMQSTDNGMKYIIQRE